MYWIGNILESGKFDRYSLGDKWCNCNMTYTHTAQFHVFCTIKARDNSKIHPTSTRCGLCLTWNKHGQTFIPSSLWLFEELLSLLAQAEVVSFGAVPVEGHDKSKLDDSSFHDLIYKTRLFLCIYISLMAVQAYRSRNATGTSLPAHKSFLHLYLMLQAEHMRYFRTLSQ